MRRDSTSRYPRIAGIRVSWENPEHEDRATMTADTSGNRTQTIKDQK